MTQFWLLTTASSVSKMGNAFLRLAVPLAILHVTGSPSAAILSVALENLPHLAGPVLGTLIDRFPRRTVFAASELSQAVLVVLLAGALEAERLGLVYVLLVGLGLGSVISNITSEFSLVPSLAPADAVGKAYSRYMFCVDSARFAGPMLGGLLIAVSSTRIALYADAATFVLTALVVLRLRVGRDSTPKTESFVQAFASGWCAFTRLPGIPRLTVSLGLYNLGAGSIATVLVAVGSDRWDWTPSFTGGVVSAGAIAGALGAAVGGRWERRSWSARILLWMAASCVCALPLLTGSSWLSVIGFVGMSFSAGAMNVATMAYRHHVIPDEFVGRVNTVVRSLIMGSIPASALILSRTATSESHLLMFLPAFLAILLALAVWRHPRLAPAVPHPPQDAPVADEAARS